MEMQRYLERLQIPKAEPPTLEFLSLLHQRHLLTVPFENIDIHRGVDIRLDREAVLDKIVERRRGGICYELNLAFAWLLGELGYPVTLLAGEVRNDQGGFGIPFDHMLLRIDLDEPYLADVGFGRGFVRPLALEQEQEVRQVGCGYRVARDGEWRMIEFRERRSLAFVPLYRFTLEPRQAADFAEACHYQQTSTESSFTQRVICSAAIPDGRVTLEADRLIITRNGVRTENPVPDEDAWRRELRRHFGLALD